MHLLKTIAGTFVVLAVIAGVLILFYEVDILPLGRALNYDAYLSIMITALGVIMAVFAIFVGLAAIWGYAGLKDSVREMAAKEVAKSITETLEKYPKSADMFNVLQRLQDHADWYDKLRNEVATAPESETVSAASKESGIRDVAADTPLESVARQTTPIEPYPGEEHGDDDNGNGKTGS